MKSKKTHGKWMNSLLWTLGSSSPAICYVLIAQLTYALTESYSMSAFSVGMIFLCSRVFDGITDFIAGAIIDRTHSKLGKGRVWDLTMIGAWIFAILCFSVPGNLSSVGKIIFVFIMYNLYTSVFSTFQACAETIRMKNSLDEEGRAHAVAFSGVATTLLATIVSIALPILISIFGSKPHGWTLIAVIIGIPNMIFTVIRFILLPESYNSEEEIISKKEKLGIVESVRILFSSKYAIIIFAIAFIRALIVTATGSAGTYYFTYVYGDVAAAAIPGMTSLFVCFGAALIPILSKKLGNGRTVMYSLILTAAACLLRYLMPTNLVWYTVCSLVVGLCQLPVSYLGALMLIDAMEYNTYKKGQTPEGIFASARSIADKIGLGLGSAVTGIILQAGALTNGGYTASSIKFLNNGFPAIGWLIAAAILIFYDLDKKMPEVRKQVEKSPQ